MNNAQSIVGFSKTRQAEDFYPTPPEATEALFAREKFEGNVLEPACGNGMMSEVIKKHNPVTSADKYDRGYGETGVDFLTMGLTSFDNVITNPPYKDALAFVNTAKLVADKKVAMLLKLVFLESRGRHKFFQDTKFPLKKVYVFCDRLKIYKEGVVGKNSGLIAYAWFVWDKEHTGAPTIEWIKL